MPTDPSKDYYFMHRNTGDTESVIVEYGFIDSTGDDANQIKNNWQKYAEAVVKAVAEYAGYSYNQNQNMDNIYIVKPGDTLYSIARINNVSLSDLKKANNLVGNIISIGQILTIPTTNNFPSYELENGMEEVYVVKPGDTLYSIAKLYNTTINKIKNLNNLTSNILSIGQNLKVSDNLNFNTYEVKSGDTLYSIARRFGTTVDEIKRLNNLVSNLLSISQIIKIPLK